MQIEAQQGTLLVPIQLDVQGRIAVVAPLTDALLQQLVTAMTVGSLTTQFTCQGVPNGQMQDFTIPLQGIVVGSVYTFSVTGAPTGLIATAEVAQTNGVPVANMITVRVNNTTGINSGQFALTVQAVKS